jgi:hypothetical protein
MDGKEANATASFFSSIVSTGKDLAALLRDFVLLIIFLALLLCPEKFNDIMIKAGFEEGSIIGMKWKKGITKSDIALKEAQATITVLGKQLDSVSKILGEAKKLTDDPDLKKKITEIQVKNNVVKSESKLVQASVKNTITSNAVLVENAQKAVNDNSSWGVVFSGDSNLKSAQYEVKIVDRKFGISKAIIYLRQGSYRSIAILNDRYQAEIILDILKKRRPDSYIVPMSTWCKNSIQRDGYLECIGK